MTTQKTIASVLVGLSLVAPAFVFAEGPGVTVTTDAPAQTSVGSEQIKPGATVKTDAGAVPTAKMQQAIKKGDQEIDRRVAALNELLTNVTSMKKVTEVVKQNFTTNIQTQISTLAAVKAKIDADTDGATLKTDIQSIAPSYRIFALVIPQGHIAAAADREATLINMFSGMGAKLKTRIDAAGAAGADVVALNTAFADIGVKLTSAQTHAQAALVGSATLAPDDGDKTKMASNEAALKAARKELQAAQQDIVAARKDLETILKGLKNINATATTTVKTQ